MPLDIREHPTWVPTVHTLKTVSDLREFYRRELAPARSNQNKWLPDLNQDGSHDERDLAEFKDRVYRIQGHRRRRDRRLVADPDRRLQRRPDVRRRRRAALRPGRPAGRHRSRHLPAEGRQRRRHHRPPDHHQRGLHDPPGVRRSRHLGPDDGPGRPAVLGGRRHRLRRHRQERQALVAAQPGRRVPLRSGRIQFRSLRHRHPQPAGVLVRQVRQPDQRRQRRRPSGRDRAPRLHSRRLRQRLAFELAVRQVHGREEQSLQRVDGREHVQAALRRPGSAHRSAGRGLSRRPVGHGLQPGHGVVGRSGTTRSSSPAFPAPRRTRASTPSS